MDVLAAAAAEALISSPTRSTKHPSPDDNRLGPLPSAPGLPSLAAKLHHSCVLSNNLPFIFIPGGGKNKNPRAIASNTIQGGTKASPPGLSTPIPVYIELPVATFIGIPAELFTGKRKYSQRPSPAPVPAPAHSLPKSATNTIPKRAASTNPQCKTTAIISTFQLNSKSNLISGPLCDCSECGATHSVNWRSGPKGPKTLCNACGVKRLRIEGGKRNLDVNFLLSPIKNPYDPASHVVRSSRIRSHEINVSSKRKKRRQSSVVEDDVGEKEFTAARRSSRTSQGAQNYFKMNGGREYLKKNPANKNSYCLPL